MLFFIGPCLIESEEFLKSSTEKILEKTQGLINPNDLVIKSSFDKANRSSIDSKRGPGIEEGLKILGNIKREFNVKVITDYHEPNQANIVAEVVDFLQVPAFLCRQTDMLIKGAEACKKFNRTLKIKKGQWVSPADTINIIEKANSILPKDKILLTERGTAFGYNNLIVDMSSFSQIQKYGVKVIHDATHSVQKPGGLGASSGGAREFITPLAKAAVAAGADGLFIEAHPDPTNAWSDAACQLNINDLPQLIESLNKVHEAAK